ncbi:MAG TPA: succinate dehydrogenase, cytochrome b556 subunit [Thermomicrobiales bacterium]|nr:succinate dehydrogenase, cytochrome b556 subunit [Chloroflexota bacterium]HCG28493.1 succinate dehydrogenase, cytochrome b556 subunit [Chloroflexota bacterium]HQX62634.1 succinate dehydrogenase, cytochrome b556 subunit [Thermomicrobiales bacterium]HQZ88671.1 succinate dehydrogenase, cytochrome b556 subunit [Thermomicrobiales bacterium]HRA32032.1 succinate dehydrogenase, cytochrome b556 subunit [Thermomicrobiales bacterium]
MQRIYRGDRGMIAWALHRLTGLGVLLFLLVHIADIFVISYGPAEFNSLLFIYHSLGFRLMEVLLVGALYYHAFNGIRIILIDFWDRASLIQHQLWYGTIVVFLVTFIPTAILMTRPLFS